MAGSVATKCPVCGRAVAVGLVSQTLIQHENKNNELCPGTGQQPVLSAAATRAAGAPKAAAPKGSTAVAPSTGSRVTRPSGAAGGGAGAGSAARTATPRRGVQVRRVEVDQDRLRAREEKMEQLRLEREARARARNEFYTIDEPAGGTSVDEPAVDEPAESNTEPQAVEND